MFTFTIWDHVKHGIHNPRGERESKKYIEQCYIAMSFLHSHLPIGIGDSPLFFFSLSLSTFKFEKKKGKNQLSLHHPY